MWPLAPGSSRPSPASLFRCSNVASARSTFPWLQSTANLGLLLALALIMVLQATISPCAHWSAATAALLDCLHMPSPVCNVYPPPAACGPGGPGGGPAPHLPLPRCALACAPPSPYPPASRSLAHHGSWIAAADNMEVGAAAGDGWIGASLGSACLLSCTCGAAGRSLPRPLPGLPTS